MKTYMNPYKEIEVNVKMSKGLVEEIKDKEYNRGYEKGMEDAWDTIKWICLYPDLKTGDLIDIFGQWRIDLILSEYSPKEAKEKIDNYIKKKKKNEEFHVGDEVKCKTGIYNKGVVISIETINTGEKFLRVMFSDTCMGAYSVNDTENKLIKTGRHFDDVEKLLKLLKED